MGIKNIITETNKSNASIVALLEDIVHFLYDHLPHGESVKLKKYFCEYDLPSISEILDTYSKTMKLI